MLQCFVYDQVFCIMFKVLLVCGMQEDRNPDLLKGVLGINESQIGLNFTVLWMVISSDVNMLYCVYCWTKLTLLSSMFSKTNRKRSLCPLVHFQNACHGQG